ncbi:hypothetical protein FisN_12Hh254 [Fistulifera solaris]|uniref:Major facilitator superfamily (MFS) profile domain-containing protein n=1 Tax=Fistulifera solaris TaxID=1519565 RepID=A0A1Z5KBK9_FISSO|nr:hypothetical protein FisN_12Hh254 [Fistulifera solaris]|eukprot:GAX23680.1 hypothetical protein FisN_12Hh254 [Fistulifera solaris]
MNAVEYQHIPRSEDEPLAEETFVVSEQYPSSDNNSTDDCSIDDTTSAINEVITIDDAMERLGYGAFQYLLCAAAGVCFAADAMQLMLLSFLSVVLKDEWNLSPQATEAMASAVFAGAMVGTLLLGPLADSIGRRPVFLITALDISVFGLLASLAPNVQFLAATIFMVGLGVGGLTVPFDILAEFLPRTKRGTSLLLIEYFWTVGSLYVVAVAYFSLHGGHWRLFVVFCSIPCLISLFVGFFFVPESARWLVTKGHLKEAMTVLRRSATQNGLDPDVVFPPSMTLAPERQHREATIAELLSPQWRDITLSLWGTWGLFAFGYYGTVMAITNVFAHSDKNHQTDRTYHFDYTAIFMSSAAEMVGTTLAIWAVDRVGRIPSQVVSYLIAGFSISAFCMLASTGSHHIMLLGLSFLARVFEMSATCITWVSTAEILTTEVRGTGHSTSNAMARLGAFFCPFLVVGNTPLHVVAIVMLLVHLITAACSSRLPETRGLGMDTTNEDSEEEPVSPRFDPNDEHGSSAYHGHLS